jgi:hypothetical protein
MHMHQPADGRAFWPTNFCTNGRANVTDSCSQRTSKRISKRPTVCEPLLYTISRADHVSERSAYGSPDSSADRGSDCASIVGPVVTAVDESLSSSKCVSDSVSDGIAISDTFKDAFCGSLTASHAEAVHYPGAVHTECDLVTSEYCSVPHNWLSFDTKLRAGSAHPFRRGDDVELAFLVY